MIRKKVLRPDRVGKINGGFSFIPLPDGFLSALSQKELLLYFFLVLVSDRCGLSFYSDDTICSLLGISADEYRMARSGLIKRPRDRALFYVMLRCGLRVQEVANLTLDAIDLRGRRIHVKNGKGGKGRMVYISDDAYHALIHYLEVRSSQRSRKLFLVEKGPCLGQPISVRGIQKRVEHYARKANLRVSCHQLRHTMATQLLNADADLVTIQDLLGHVRIRTTQRYAAVSNLKVQRDYFKAMNVIIEKRGGEMNTT